eukprot:Gb_07584 [translate_table: standard]
MDSTNLGHQDLVDQSASLLDSTVQMGSFGGVPDSHVWNQDFLLDGSGSSEGVQNMQNNFAPNLNEVLCSRALRQDEHQMLDQPCDQNHHVKKMEDISGGWELRNLTNFQAEDAISLSTNNMGKQIPSLPYSLQLLDDRVHSTCTISDLGSWSMSPNTYNPSGLDIPMPQYQLGNVKEEFPMSNYSAAPNTYLQGFGSDPYKSNELGFSNILESGSKSFLKSINSSCHLGPSIIAGDQESYNISSHGLLPSAPSKQSGGVLTFSSSCMSMPVLDFLASKPDHMRLQQSQSTSSLNYLQDGKQKPHTAQNRTMGYHDRPLESSSETKRSNNESTSDPIFKRPRLESNSTLPTFKTDTASVLLEVIGYIKFLQEQIRALSMPYMTGCTSAAQGDQKGWGSSDKKDGTEPKQDLRSRGLCLVPLSSTLHVANDNGADYWSPSGLGEIVSVSSTNE